MTEFSKQIPFARDSSLEKPRSWWDKQTLEAAQLRPAQPTLWPKLPPSNPDARFKVTNMGPSVAFSPGADASQEISAGWGRPNFGRSASALAGEVRSFVARPIDRVKMMTDTVNDAFRRISGGSSDQQYVGGLSSEFARMHKLPDFSKGQWKPVDSLHSPEAYEHPLPGSSGMALKVYLNDGDHGGRNTATVTTPTSSVDHYIGALQYIAGMPVNEDNARRYIEAVIDNDRDRR